MKGNIFKITPGLILILSNALALESKSSRVARTGESDMEVFGSALTESSKGKDKDKPVEIKPEDQSDAGKEDSSEGTKSKESSSSGGKSKEKKPDTKEKKPESKDEKPSTKENKEPEENKKDKKSSVTTMCAKCYPIGVVENTCRKSSDETCGCNQCKSSCESKCSKNKETQKKKTECSINSAVECAKRQKAANVSAPCECKNSDGSLNLNATYDPKKYFGMARMGLVESTLN